MKYENTFFQLYKRNFYSQNGEDGIINELITRLDLNSGWLCEFGAGNGIRFSNTLNLLIRGSYKGVFIESDEKEFNELKENHQANDNMILINKIVSFPSSSENSLDNILKDTPIPTTNMGDNFVLLSVDIDSYDYQVWDSLKNYNPIIVIIEINSSADPTNEKYIHNGNDKLGSSFIAMYKLGLKKGYSLVCHTGNMIFLRSDYFKKAGIKSPLDPLSNFRRDWISKELYIKLENI